MPIVSANDAIKLRDGESAWFKNAETEINGDMSNAMYLRSTGPRYRSTISGIPTITDTNLLTQSMLEAGYLNIEIVSAPSDRCTVVLYSVPTDAE